MNINKLNINKLIRTVRKAKANTEEVLTLQLLTEIEVELEDGSNLVEAPVKPACEFTQEHFSIVGRAIEKWIKQDLVVEGKDMIGKKEGAKTLRERINEELSKSV